MASRAAAWPTVTARTRAAARSAVGRSSPAASAGFAAAATAAAAELPGSSLATQNDLFLAALRARRDSRPQESLRFLARLIDGYPDGPLIEAAMAERMELLLSAGDASAAARVAGQYVRRFPDGFARPDADRLVRSAP
jgi:TolA-binding protein